MHKKLLIVVLVLVCSTSLFAGCSLFGSSNSDGTAPEQKNAKITMTGMLTQTENAFFITDASGVIHDVETYTVSFEEYVGKTITVTGEYSGDTLYVTEILE